MSTAVSPVPVPAAGRLPVRETGALGRIEGRRLLRHPLFLLGVALSLLFFRDEGDGATLAQFVDGLGWLPLAGGTLIAANLAALRSRRDRTEELYASLPNQRSTRVAGQLLGVLWTLPISAALMAAVVLDHSLFAAELGARPPLATVELVQGPLMVLAFGAVGILLARLAPSPIVGPIVVVALVASQVPGVVAGGGWVAWALPMSTHLIHAMETVPCPGIAVGDCQTSGWSLSGNTWHAAYLVGLTLLAGVAAAVSWRRALPYAGLALLATALAVATKLAAG
jgi:hypothetical protein